MEDTFLRCPFCKTEIPPGASQCIECGRSLREIKERSIEELSKLPGVGENRAELLYMRGLTSAENIVKSGLTGLAALPQIGFKSAKKILEGAREEVEKKEEGGGDDDDLKSLDQLEIALKSIEEDDDSFEMDEEYVEEEDLDDEINQLYRLMSEEGPDEERGEEIDEEIVQEEIVEEEVPDEEGMEEIYERITRVDEEEVSEEISEPEKKTKNCPSCRSTIPVSSQGCPICGVIFDVPGEGKNLKSIFVPMCSFIVPLFLMIYVGLEFFSSLLANPWVYPYQALLYFTPLPLFDPSWLSSISLSFLVVLGLFILTVKSYGFDSTKHEFIVKDRKLVSLGLIFASMITVSLAIYMIITPFYLANILSYVLFILILSTVMSQIYILVPKEESIEEQTKTTLCLLCGSMINSSLKKCPECGYDIEEQEKYTDTEEGLMYTWVGSKDKESVYTGEDKKKDTITCSICDTDIPYDAERCPECGEPKGEEKKKDFFEGI